MIVMVLALTLTLQVRLWPVAELMQVSVLVVAMVTNCAGSVIMMSVLRGTIVGLEIGVKLTGSYMRLIVKV